MNSPFQIVHRPHRLGGTGVGNFEKPDLALYEAALEAAGREDPVISSRPIRGMNGDLNEEMLQSCHSLHQLGIGQPGARGLRDFWDHLDRLRSVGCDGGGSDPATGG